MRGHVGFFETTIAGPSAMHCHCQATQETENVRNVICCLAVPSFVHVLQTHTHTQEDFYRAFGTCQCFSNTVAQNFFNCEPPRHEWFGEVQERFLNTVLI